MVERFPIWEFWEIAFSHFGNSVVKVRLLVFRWIADDARFGQAGEPGHELEDYGLVVGFELFPEREQLFDGFAVVYLVDDPAGFDLVARWLGWSGHDASAPEYVFLLECEGFGHGFAHLRPGPCNPRYNLLHGRRRDFATARHFTLRPPLFFDDLTEPLTECEIHVHSVLSQP